MSDVKNGKLDTGKAWYTGKNLKSSFNGMKWSNDGNYVYLADIGRGAVVQLDIKAARPQPGRGRRQGGWTLVDPLCGFTWVLLLYPIISYIYANECGRG